MSALSILRFSVAHPTGAIKTRLGLAFALCLALLCPGCFPAAITAKDALAAAKMFLDTLSLLETASRLYRADVITAVQATKEQLRAPTPEQRSSVVLPKVALTWEEKWEKVKEQTKALEEQFDEVTSASERYWRILEQVTEDIDDENIRKTEKSKNDAARAKWDRAYESAKKQIAAAKALRDKGNDVGRTMLAAALRGQLAEYTNTLDSIAKEAERLLSSLEVITEEGRLIVGSLK